MPIYHYQCTNCQLRETRVAGVDDHFAICVRCQHLMIRLDNELFGPYFAESTALPKDLKSAEISGWLAET
ncbi:MAG: hypothetical protein ACLFUU_11365 [Desulfobacteraceae bacterium]